MHKLAVVFFYACAVLSIAFTALIFIGKASAQQHSHLVGHDAPTRLLR
jgi:hypothetical protein